jgi:hypothetical protein
MWRNTQNMNLEKQGKKMALDDLGETFTN